MQAGQISVIVPIYNTEVYLRKCVDSILMQSYTDLQVILVNDGSPDNSLAICQEYADKDPRVVVVDKPNGGLSSARNAGLDKATGELIAFVDSDDYLEPDAYEKLMQVSCETGADMVCMGFHTVNDMGEVTAKSVFTEKPVELFDQDTYLMQMCLRKQSCSVCGALCKATIFKQCRFDERRLNEDYLLLARFFLQHVSTIAVVRYCGYNYYVRQNSISRQGLGKSSVDAVYNGMELKQMAEKCQKAEIASVISAYAVYQARTAMLIMPYEKRREYAEFIAFCRQVIKKNLPHFCRWYGGVKELAFCRLFIYRPSLALWIFKKIKGN